MNENAESRIASSILRHIAENSDSEVLRELAGEVLRGNVTLADGMAFPAYAEALAPKLDGFTQWYDSLSDDERQKTAANCATELEKVEAQLAKSSCERLR